jgi:PHD/YefM family antitoxin component YafN of YafNO toxin-antitoxin module
LPDPFSAATPEIEWRKIIGLRNILIHEYYGASLPIASRRHAVKYGVVYYEESAYNDSKNGACGMPNIKPVSDLRNYTEILRSCQVGEPVFLTKNGRGRYVLLDMQEYEKQQAVIKLLSKFSEADDAIKAGETWKSLYDLKKALDV